MQRFHKLPLQNYNPYLLTKETIFSDFLQLVKGGLSSIIPEEYLTTTNNTCLFDGDPLVTLIGLSKENYDINKSYTNSKQQLERDKEAELNVYRKQGFPATNISYYVLHCQSISNPRITIQEMSTLEYIDTVVMTAWLYLNEYNSDDLVNHLMHGNSLMSFELNGSIFYHDLGRLDLIKKDKKNKIYESDDSQDF